MTIPQVLQRTILRFTLVIIILFLLSSLSVHPVFAQNLWLSALQNEPPVITEGDIIVMEGETLQLHASDPENDPLTWSILKPAERGTVSVGQDGLVVYTTDPGCTGPDWFLVEVSDGNGTDYITVTRDEAANCIFHVDPSATGGLQNGKSWENAFTDLYQALGVAVSGDQIWVIKGTYRPGASRATTFILPDGVAIYGGFAGGETDRSQRNWQANRTILSGDLGRNDQANFTNYSENAYHVLTASSVSSSTRLDGFYITGGYANGSGANGQGGGILITNGSPTLANIIFSENYAVYGGAIYNTGTPYLVNIILEGNKASSNGGAIFTTADLTVANAVFALNEANSGGGLYNQGLHPTLVNSTFYGNIATASGGAIANINAAPKINNCIFWADSAASGSEIYNSSSVTPLIRNSFVQDITNDPGAGIYGDPEHTPQVANSGAAKVHIMPGSPSENSGSNADLPPDAADLDDDGDRAEPLPVDLDGSPRVVKNVVDLGPYELQNGPAHIPTVLYVKNTAAGANNGTSWADAYINLQDAITASLPGDEIWVANGTYRPTSSNRRFIFFPLKNDVAIYGGFYGNENTRSQREWRANPTILSGDLLNNDAQGAINNSDNSYWVVGSSGTDESAVLDGVFILSGNATGSAPRNMGAGMHIENSSVALANLSFANHYANKGGALTASDSNLTFSNVEFMNNKAGDRGGAVYASNSSITFNNARFTSNSGYMGGAISTADSSHLYISNSAFTGNTANSFGYGGAISDYGSNSILNNVIFKNNTSTHGGGAISFAYTTSSILANVLFYGNKADYFGGAITNASASVTIYSSTFTENDAQTGDAIHNGKAIAIYNSILWGNGTDTTTNEISKESSATTPVIVNAWIQDGSKTDPLFINPAAENYALRDTSPALNKGANNLLPPDSLDLDNDGNLSEPLPLDLSNRARIREDTVDIGAYEYKPLDTAPTISAIDDQTTQQGTPTPEISFTISDEESPASALTLTAVSSNPDLVPEGNIIFGGNESNRTVTLTPAANRIGKVTITITVSDGSLSTQRSFVLNVKSDYTVFLPLTIR